MSDFSVHYRSSIRYLQLQKLLLKIRYNLLRFSSHMAQKSRFGVKEKVVKNSKLVREENRSEKHKGHHCIYIC
jgi:hypothetical protein